MALDRERLRDAAEVETAKNRRVWLVLALVAVLYAAQVGVVLAIWTWLLEPVTGVVIRFAHAMGIVALVDVLLMDATVPLDGEMPVSTKRITVKLLLTAAVFLFALFARFVLL